MIALFGCLYLDLLKGFVLQEFISFCEAMELVPEEELEALSQARPNAFADQRARKVAFI